MDFFVWTEVLLGLAELSRTFFLDVHYNEMCVKKVKKNRRVQEASYLHPMNLKNDPCSSISGQQTVETNWYFATVLNMDKV